MNRNGARLAAVLAFLTLATAVGEQALARTRRPGPIRVLKPTISSGAWAVINRKRPAWQKTKATVEALQAIQPMPYSPLVSDLVTSIEAINFDENAATVGAYEVPPDPMGVAGHNHVLNVVNTSIEWYTKDGTRQHREDLEDFFSSLNPADGSLFDPKATYDQYADRFVVLVAGQTTSPFTSDIYLAVSQTDDPNDGWYFQKFSTIVYFGALPSWLDFPGLAVGPNAIYVTGNMFTLSFMGTRLWIIDKGLGTGGLYDGGTSTVNVYDPSTEAGLGSQAFTLQPAQMFGTPPGNTGTYLFSTGWVDSDDQTTDYLSVIRVDDPLGTPTFTNFWINLGNIHNEDDGVPDAPQKDSDKLISANDSRALQAVWRHDALYGVYTVNPPSGTDQGQATAFWFKIDTSDPNNLSLADDGYIGGEEIAPSCYTFFPAIAVNKNDEVGIGFSASAATIYPGAYYTGRKPDDPAGTMQTPKTLRAGIDYYYRAFGGSRNRWGDYSGAAVDPSDDVTFWVYNEYAIERGTVLSDYPDEDGRYGTAFGKFTVSESATVLVSVKVFLEGPYDANGDTMKTALKSQGLIPTSQPYNTAPWNYDGNESVSEIPAGVVDWVLLELRSGTAASTSVAKRACFLKSDGTIVDLDGTSAVEFEAAAGDYYVVVYHRNHLAAMTANPVTLTSTSATLYDFTSASDQFYGGAGGAKEIETGVWGMIAGDANADGGVYAEDYTSYQTSQGNEGYSESADFNLDGGVYAEDYTLYQINQGQETSVP